MARVAVAAEQIGIHAIQTGGMATTKPEAIAATEGDADAIDADVAPTAVAGNDP
jgi:hypothetical protein